MGYVPAAQQGTGEGSVCPLVAPADANPYDSQGTHPYQKYKNRNMEKYTKEHK